ncbi:LolA family protein [Dethiobacter alkaliphilus]|uniref:LolA family protein n=1 Tax=Dethiobacter alkaliphilus TaxID=427926 RepID=UPI0022269AF9|nr:hypothetical protein [Dethiobacter alkaliphilus]MCW3490387.1 hypothetical protein [Dethiobacter alkaliphilus]
MKRPIIKVGALMVLILGLLFVKACTMEKTYSADEIIDNVIKENKGTSAYYKEMSINIQVGEEIGETIIKEWYSLDGQKEYRRIESESEGSPITYTVSDGQQSITYVEGSNEATVVNMSDFAIEMGTEYEQVFKFLEGHKKSHNIIQKSPKVEINGRSAFHIVLEPKDKEKLSDKQSLWIDQETWIILKMHTEIEEMTMTLEVTEFDLTPTIEYDLFTLNLPDDIQLIDIDDMETGLREIDIEEAMSYIDSDFLYASSEDLILNRIFLVELDREFRRIELTFEYFTEGSPYINLSIIRDEKIFEDNIESITPTEDALVVRGQNGSFIELDSFTRLNWRENGLSYAISTVKPGITVEELIGIAEELTYYSVGL